MGIKRKLILSMMLPILLMGLMFILIILGPINKMFKDEVETSLKGAASALFSAYMQNSGDFMVSKNGDVWKGDYNISHSESLVDGIRDKTGMEVTFFFADKRIMTSAKDQNGKRILETNAGQKVVDRVLHNGKEYFSNSVFIAGKIYYGYYIPVFEKEKPVGMVFAGTEKKVKDAANRGLIMLILLLIIGMIAVCVGFAVFLSFSLTEAIKHGIHAVYQVANGNLNTMISDKFLKRKDEMGKMVRAIQELQDILNNMIKSINEQTKLLFQHSGSLANMASDMNLAVNQVQKEISETVQSTAVQEENAKITSDNVLEMGNMITAANNSTYILNQHSDTIRKAGQSAVLIMRNLLEVNEKVKENIVQVEQQTIQTNSTVKNIQEATKLITQISKQTNILSLNASIEAARAGSYGQGFVVVAQEVKELAMKSQEAAEKIDLIISCLTNDADDSIKMMGKVKNVIQEQDNRILETDHIFAEIMEGIDLSVQEINDLKEKTQKLEETRENIVELIQSLYSGAQENALSAQKNYDSSLETAKSFNEVGMSADVLSRIAGELVACMEFFEENETAAKVEVSHYEKN